MHGSKLSGLRSMGMDEMKLGTLVEVTNVYTSTVQNGIVINVESNRNRKLIDGKPVASEKVTQVTIAYNHGGEVVITNNNIRDYVVRKAR